MSRPSKNDSAAATAAAIDPNHRLKQQAPAPPSLKWLNLGLLGSGSFGSVSLALNLVDHSLFAIKSCPASSPLLLSQLLNELHILRSLRSPFVLRCLGAHHLHDSASPALFLEYMDGGSLTDLLRRSGGKLSDHTLVARYTRSVLQGLHYLHTNGIVHCDIKSHNILFDSSGRIKIADFGAARRLHANSHKSQVKKTANCSILRGTPLYMAPEVVQGLEQGPPSDIWSLGCTVVEMLEGRPPWGHISNLGVLFLKLGTSEGSPPLPELVSAEAKDFLQLCLQRDPKLRPTAAELLQHPFLSGKAGAEGEKLIDLGSENEWAESPRSTLVKMPELYSWGSDECCTAASSMPNVGAVPSTFTAAAACQGAGRRATVRPNKCNSEEAINEYTLKIKGIVESLASIGVQVEDDDKVEVCLRGLTPAYKQFKTSIQTKENILCFADLVPMLVVEEKNLGEDASSSQGRDNFEQVFYSNRGRGRGRGAGQGRGHGRGNQNQGQQQYQSNDGQF
ncbi:hypothetical protein L7F22_066683 [Adiantum nelumboides]|nr:hypothetical protein [Adiantum nelumboides]